MHFLIKLATRERPAKALEVLRKYQAMQSGHHTVDYKVSIDEDDSATMAVKGEMDKIAMVTAGRSISKIHACNRDVNLSFEWDILVLISDDMIPVVEGWDDRIALAMTQHHPDLDGCLHFNDGHTRDALCTLPIMGRKAYDKAGCIYNPEYLSLWCDNEWTEKHKPVYIPEVIIEHQHPHYGKAPRDPLFQFNESLDHIDRKTYLRRKAAGFPSIDKQPLFTIGICTMPGREVSLRSLRYNLDEQIADLPAPDLVEIIEEHDDGKMHTGAKRQKILDRANGRYIAFVDDDDTVSIHYVKSIVQTLAMNPLVDCLNIEGEMTTRGMNPEKFIHSMANGIAWRKEDGVHLRPPNHLNPVRIDLARRAGFRNMTNGEDMNYSKDLFPLLKTSEWVSGNKPLYFYLMNPETSLSGLKKEPEIAPSGMVEPQRQPIRQVVRARPVMKRRQTL